MFQNILHNQQLFQFNMIMDQTNNNEQQKIINKFSTQLLYRTYINIWRDPESLTIQIYWTHFVFYVKVKCKLHISMNSRFIQKQTHSWKGICNMKTNNLNGMKAPRFRVDSIQLWLRMEIRYQIILSFQKSLTYFILWWWISLVLCGWLVEPGISDEIL